MATGLTDLPVELQARVAEFLPGKAELLALRCSAGSCKQVVTRAVKHHDVYKRFYARNSLQNAALVAIGRVFGAGCRYLNTVSGFPAVTTALESFVTSTGGLLSGLSIEPPRDNHITPDTLLILCRACPLLKNLYVPRVPNIQPTHFVAVSQACPLLEYVVLPTGGLSPAETYARQFPRLRELKFVREWDSQIHEMPICFDVIAVAAETCVHVTRVVIPRAAVTPDFVARLLETPLRDRVTSLSFTNFFGSFSPQLWPEAGLQLVRGFPNLRKLAGPFENALIPRMAPTEFFEQLALAAPMLRRLSAVDIDDECMRIICNRCQLEEINLFITRRDQSDLCVTPAVVDIIVKSSSAASLCKATVSSTLAAEWGAAELLGIVQGCPNLKQVGYYNRRELSSGSVCSANIVSARRLLKSRGGTLEGSYASKCPPFF